MKRRLQAVIVLLVCLYEASSILLGRTPTITRLVHENRHDWRARGTVYAATALLLYHLLIEQEGKGVAT